MLPVLPAHAQPLRACCHNTSAAVLSSGLGQLPGTASLAQVLSRSILQHARGLAAQAARAMEQPAFQHPEEAADAREGAPAAPQPCAAPPPAPPAPASPTVPEVPQAAATAAAVVQAHQPRSPTGVKKTFYKRKLPCPPATEFSSTGGTPLAAAAGICRSQVCQQAAVLWHDLGVPPSHLSTSAALRSLLLVAGRLLFAEALQQGTMSGFFKLIEQYRCVQLPDCESPVAWARAAAVGSAAAAAPDKWSPSTSSAASSRSRTRGSSRASSSSMGQQQNSSS